MRLAVNDNETSFEKLVLTKDEYHKSQLNSGEISYKGNLYDVKSVIMKGDFAELLVINDIKEKFLLGEIKDFLRKSNQSKKELPEQLQKFLSLNYLSEDNDNTIYCPLNISGIYYYPDRKMLSDHNDIPSPPPKLG